jgi:hypothetical protein
MNGFRNTELWPVDRYVFTDDDFDPFMVTDRPEKIQLEKPTAEGIAHAVKLVIPRQTPGYNGYTPVENITPLPSNSAERQRTKSRRKHCIWSGIN